MLIAQNPVRPLSSLLPISASRFPLRRRQSNPHILLPISPSQTKYNGPNSTVILPTACIHLGPTPKRLTFPGVAFHTSRRKGEMTVGRKELVARYETTETTRRERGRKVRRPMVRCLVREGELGLGR